MSKYDWGTIERDFRTGQLSIRHLAARHEVPESTVRSKAQALARAVIVEAHPRSIYQRRVIAERLAQHLATMEITDENHDKFSRSLNAGTDALMKTVKGERQAYQLDEEQEHDSERPYAHLSSDELHTRIRELTEKLGIR